MTKSDLVRARVEAASRAPRQGSAPAISVVVASSGSPRQLRACLTLLETQRAAIDAELVVVRAEQPMRLAATVSDAATARLVSAPPGSTRAQLRSLGLAAASGDIVALTDDEHLVPADWLHSMCWRVRPSEPSSSAEASVGGDPREEGWTAAPLVAQPDSQRQSEPSPGRMLAENQTNRDGESA